MDDSPCPSLLTRLPRPPRGGSVRAACGNGELVLEAVRGGFSLLWLDGQEARRYALGLPDAVSLQIELRAPGHPVRVATRETLALLPGGRIAGYLCVPLVPTITWTDGCGGAGIVLELMPRHLAGAWDEHCGVVLHTASALHVRFPMRSPEPRAVVPVRLYNDGAATCSPAFVPVALATADLRERRGSIVVAPRRIRWPACAPQVVAVSGVTTVEVAS